MPDDELKPIMAKTEFRWLSEGALTILWEEFSQIQCAEYLTPDKESGERFCKWLSSGDANDVWS